MLGAGHKAKHKKDKVLFSQRSHSNVMDPHKAMKHWVDCANTKIKQDSVMETRRVC